MIASIISKGCQGRKGDLHDRTPSVSHHAVDGDTGSRSSAISHASRSRDTDAERLLMRPKPQSVEEINYWRTRKGRPGPPLDRIQTDSRTVATSKRRRMPDRARMEVDLRDTLNAKRNKDGDLRAKLDERRVMVAGERVLTNREVYTAEVYLIYDGKTDPRSHVSHVRKMMALWNHMDALMCRVFPSSLGDLGLKWSDKLPPRSIENFHQLTESFVARFVIRAGSRRTLKKFVDEEKTQAKKAVAKPNPRFDRQDGDDEEERNADEENNQPLGTIHMIGELRDPDLKNRIKGEIWVLKQIYEVLSVHSPAKKLRKETIEPGSITFTKADLERVQHPHSNPLVIQLKINNYDVRRILVDTGS
ncbi:hypothetical protein Acr_00g0040260 [Actinidia rufa]|uniref:Uncharacterized protein n=1 Tax=Actinidia rufa TaxID=165716 RepID=A0A7J0DHU0_9ERIC|nr:hypothetical protein Acr_00g0040260 [Actinidia rufa]